MVFMFVLYEGRAGAGAEAVEVGMTWMLTVSYGWLLGTFYVGAALQDRWRVVPA
jgi:hypothetical protein